MNYDIKIWVKKRSLNLQTKNKITKLVQQYTHANLTILHGWLIGMIRIPPLGQHHLAEVSPMLPATPQTYCQLECLIQDKLCFCTEEKKSFQGERTVLICL